GRRTIPVAGGVLVESEDLPAHGERVWLKGYGCVRHVRDAFEHTGDDIDAVRDEGVPVVHWVPADDNVPLRMRTMSGDVVGWAEPEFAATVVDDVVQFERVGFARVDAHGEGDEDGGEDSGERDESVSYFAHP
ncbi:MAG: glutamate--tRNA ligase, partial [Halobacteriota archaeon]